MQEIVVHRLADDLGNGCMGKLDEGVVFGGSRLGDRAAKQRCEVRLDHQYVETPSFRLERFELSSAPACCETSAVESLHQTGKSRTSSPPRESRAVSDRDRRRQSVSSIRAYALGAGVGTVRAIHFKRRVHAETP